MFAPARCLNVHPSLLPAYRGPAPIQHALLDGQSETGVCVIEMMERKKGIDAGEIWGMRRLVSSRLQNLNLRDEANHHLAHPSYDMFSPGARKAISRRW